MRSVTVYTDGSCDTKSGLGGWAAVVLENGTKRLIQGYSLKTTNQRMELQAAIGAMKFINDTMNGRIDITIYTDSQYLCTCKDHTWGWLKDEKRVNHDLWIEFVQAKIKRGHTIRFVKIKAHGDDPLNREADNAAKEARKMAYHAKAGNNVRCMHG